jgi:hypothetical protein
MKHILLLAVLFILVMGSSAAQPDAPKAHVFDMVANAAEVEGVTIERQRLALLKPGYAFRRESRSSVSILKTVREALLQTGTLTCTRADKRACTVEINGDVAKCSSGCYFVGARGGERTQ